MKDHLRFRDRLGVPGQLCYNAFMDDAQKARAAARSNWPISVHTLEECPEANAETASERVASVWQLTLDSWAMSGRSMPDYKRADMPIIRRRLGDG